MPNRQEIAGDTPWNWEIRNALPDAFVRAILNCLDEPELEWIWPRLLPDPKAQEGFFSGIENDIRSRLSQKEVLVAQDSLKKRPIDLIYVPKKYRDHEGRPLCWSESSKHLYLSTRYSDADWPFIELLGVKRLTFDDLIRQLKVLAGLRDGIRPESRWHIDLARTLLAERTQKAKVLDLPIIPLCENRWVCASEVKGKFYYDSLSSHLKVPSGLDINVIAPDAMIDPDRAALFFRLGAQSLTAAVVQERIITAHRKGLVTCFSSLLSHVQFLFASNWSNREQVTLQVLTKSKSIVPSFAVYLDCDQEFSASTYLKGNGADAHFLDSRYLEQMRTKEEYSQFMRWLIDELGLSTVPRIFSCSPSTKLCDVSADFRHILATVHSSRWLLLLRENWENYSNTMRQRNIDVNIICKVLGSQPVQCLNDRKQILKETCLPFQEWIENGATRLPMVQIDSPNDPSWSILQKFGVITKPNARFCLEWLKRTKELNLDPGDVMRLYFQLQEATEGLGEIG